MGEGAGFVSQGWPVVLELELVPFTVSRASERKSRGIDTARVCTVDCYLTVMLKQKNSMKYNSSFFSDAASNHQVTRAWN